MSVQTTPELAIGQAARAEPPTDTSPAARMATEPDPSGGASASQVEVKPSAPRRTRRYRVAAVVPCYNRREDVELLLRDFSRLDLRGIDFWVVVVDNASTVPLSTIPTPGRLRVEHLRLEVNSGGSGGYNAGMAQVLRGAGLSGEKPPADFIWMVDSDARVAPRSLRELVRAIVSDDAIAAAGSALVDPLTRQVYEIGGRVKPLNGYFVPAAFGDIDKRNLVDCQYLAACSALVRREAIEKTGLMPEIFIHGDDVEWFVQMGRRTGMRIVGAPRSLAAHPRYKFQTWVRYFITRNAFAPIDACGYGSFTRFYRACVDTCRAVGQAVMGLPELADMHLQGLADAAAGRIEGYHPTPGIPEIARKVRVRPFAELAQAVRAETAWMEADRGRPARVYWHPLLYARRVDFKNIEPQLLLMGVRMTDAQLGEWKTRALHTKRVRDAIRALGRAIALQFGGGYDVAVVPTGWPTSWFRSTTLIQVTNDGFFVRTVRVGDAFRDGARVLWKGLRLAIKLGLRSPRTNPLPPAPARQAKR